MSLTNHARRALASSLFLTLPCGAAMAQDATHAASPASATQDESVILAAQSSDQDTSLAPYVTAAPPARPAPLRAEMTGDWGGLRNRIKQAGFTLRADYVSESFAAVDGGERRGTAYAQQIRAGVDADMDRLVGWKGAIIHVTLNDRRGAGISSDFVGNRLPIQENYGGLYTRLSEATVEQNFDGGRLNLRVGFFAMGNDLGGLGPGCNFVNAAFCAHALTLSGDSGWYNYPNARWGAAVRYKLRRDVILRTGIYQVNPALNDEQNAFKPFAAGTIGALIPLEVEYDPGAHAGSKVLPGHYKLGAYYDTSRVARQGETGTVKGRYGVYLLFDQMILREGTGKRGLSLLGEFTAQPANSAPITRWSAFGLLKTGTFPGRDADTIAIGFVEATINPHLRALHAAALASTPDGSDRLFFGEAVIEASYGFQARPWLNIRPDIQYVIHPGAFSYRQTGNALAIGTQIRSQF